MNQYSSREVAKMVGLHLGTLQRYIAEGKIPAPPLLQVGAGKLRIWSDEDVDKVLKALPKIANGRKTRYSKLREKQKAQPRAAQPQHAKTAQAGGPKAVPHKSRKPKKK
jgi:excisionase family DNA binding protein